MNNSYLQIYMLSLMNTVIDHLGYNELDSDSTSTILNRMQIMNYACSLGHQGCISDSLNKWSTHKANDTNLWVIMSYLFTKRYVMIKYKNLRFQ